MIGGVITPIRCVWLPFLDQICSDTRSTWKFLCRWFGSQKFLPRTKRSTPVKTKAIFWEKAERFRQTAVNADAFWKPRRVRARTKLMQIHQTCRRFWKTMNKESTLASRDFHSIKFEPITSVRVVYIFSSISRCDYSLKLSCISFFQPRAKKNQSFWLVSIFLRPFVDSKVEIA